MAPASRRLTFPNLVSTLCLFLLLGVGASLAASPSAEAGMGICADGELIPIPTLWLDPDDVSQNETGHALFCTDETPNTTTEVESASPASGYPHPNPGWSYSIGPHQLNIAAGLVPGQGFFDVHIASHYNSVGSPAANSVDVVVSLTALAPSDTGIENFTHSGSTVPGETGTYSYDFVNAGPLNPREYTYKLIVPDPTAQVLAAPAGCDPPELGAVACHGDSLAVGGSHHVSFSVRNGNGSGDAIATFFAPWASEPDEDEELPNSAALQLPLGPAPPPAGGGPGGESPGAGGGSPGTGGKTPAASAKALGVSLPKHTLASALKQGWGVKIKALKSGKVKLTLKVGAITIATGAGKAKAGKKVTIKLKATKAAAKHLGLYVKKRARLTVVQGKAKTSSSLTLG